MAKILVDLSSTGNGYRATNTRGEVITHSGFSGPASFNLYDNNTAFTETPTGTVRMHAANDNVYIPAGWGVRETLTSTARLTSIDTTPHTQNDI